MVQRKLAAILNADVVGYSKLMSDDEAATVATLKSYRESIGRVIERHQGHIVNAPGDNILAAFDSAVEALEAAVEIQDAIRGRNLELPQARRMRFRIGVNLGDVIAEDDALYGDGVNIAARLEGLAEPGGVTLSGAVHAAVKGRVDVGFVDLGTQQVKNIPEPIQVFRVDREAEAQPRAATGLWSQPGVLVLPFANIGGDPEHDYFADGLTDDIITAIAACRSFPVIARNSAFAFKGQSPELRALSEDLDVGYVVEGSVRRAGSRVRVGAQLTDCGTLHPVWSERFDRELEDMFDLQDELTETIVAALEPALGRAERQKARTNRPDSFGAWELYQHGLSALYRRTRESHTEAKDLLARAIEADKDFTAAYAALVDAYYYDVTMGLHDDVPGCQAQALDWARKAVAIDPQDPAALCALGKAYIVARDHRTAIPELESALKLNPSLTWAHYGLGAALTFTGNPAEAIPHLEKAIRLSPYDTHIGSFMVRLSDAYLFMRDFERGAEWAREAIRRPNFQWSRHANLLVALGHLDRAGEGAETWTELRAQVPAFSIAYVRKHHLISDQDCMELYLEGLRKSGVPE